MKKKKKRYKLRHFNYTILSIIFLIAPLASLVIFNWDIYFSQNSAKTSTGFIMTLGFILLILKGAFVNIEKNSKIVINLSIILAISWFLQSILDDLTIILACSILGYIIYIPLNNIAERNKRKALVVEEESIKEEVRGNGRV